MFSKIPIMKSTKGYSVQTEQLTEAIRDADAIVIGAGAGLSVSSGFTYSGKRFEDNFSDFIQKYRFKDMYTAGFYPYETAEEYWAYWSRYVYINRYDTAPGSSYTKLLKIVQSKDYFVITTNVDHQFQLSGFDKHRLFYTQGDYGLFQCSVPCGRKTYDNEQTIRQMVAKQKNRRILTGLVPYCPSCGKPMRMNLRIDSAFAEDNGWRAAAGRYWDFLNRNKDTSVLYLEIGVGTNTPGIIKYPFWQMTFKNKNAIYACLNKAESLTPQEIKNQSICINADITVILDLINEIQGR